MALNPQNLIPGANKNGRPKITDDERAAREFYRRNETEIAKLSDLPLQELHKIANDKSLPFWKMSAARIMIEQFNKHKYDFIEARKNRVLGSPKQTVDVDSTVNHNFNVKQETESYIQKLMKLDETE